MFCLFSRPLFQPALRDDHCGTHVLSSHSKHYVNIAALLCPLDADPYYRRISAARCQFFSVIKLDDMMYTITVSALLNRKLAHIHTRLYGVGLRLGRFLSELLLARIEND